MKKQGIGIIVAFLMVLSGCTNNNRGVVEHPAFIARSTNTLELEKIELSDTATILYLKAYYSPESRIAPDKNSFLSDNQGNRYAIRAAEGLELSDWFIMPESGEKEFSLIFPPIPSNLVSINYSEGDYDSAWQFFGIQLTNKPIKVNLPKGFKDIVIDKKAVLPSPEFKTGKAKLEGQILNYSPGMSKNMSVVVAYPFEYSSAIILPIDSTGKFSCEIDAFSAHPVFLYWMESRTRCFIAPGETTSLMLNPAEISRRESRLLADKPSLGEPVYYGGFMASIAKEMANLDLSNSSTQFKSQKSYTSFMQSTTSDPETLKTFFLDEYQTKKAVLDTLDASPACKQILNCVIDLSYSYDITGLTSWIDRVYKNNRDAVEKYYDTLYSVIKDFPMLNDPKILYVEDIPMYVWQMKNKRPAIGKALGTDQGILFDIMNTSGALNDIREYKPLNEEQIAQIPVAYRKYIKNKNNEILQLIEANKSKTGFTENDIEKVANADVFPFILSKFRGKPILIDFWATWCGPCRIANQELKPVKAELADKDIVYVFVAGNTSPLETWENMIPDLPGEHFRLSAEQWAYVAKTFGVDGVPTYFFVDRKGNIKDKMLGYPGIEMMKEKILNLLNE